MMGNTELFLLLFIILLLFRGRKLPELAKGMWAAVKEYTQASQEPGSNPLRRKEDEKKYAIIDVAKKLGIETEGRSIQEISEEIENSHKISNQSSDDPFRHLIFTGSRCTRIEEREFPLFGL